MFCEIATVIGSDGRSSSLTRPGTVVVYRRTRGIWNKDREMSFITDEEDNLSDIRRKMQELISFLGECKIFVTKTATGALYFDLMKAGCSVFEVSGTPDEFLDDVLFEEEKEQANKSAQKNVAIPGPYERSPGEYVVSIKEIQGKIPGITSKQILLEFMRTGKFSSIEITCDHIPPWIEMEAHNLKYEISSEKKDINEVILMIQNPGYK
jgi:Fe-only nitrogenase accessory protein AnfO